MSFEPIVIVHGGAGDIPTERVEGKLLGVRLAATIGYKKLQETGCVLDAVEEAVRSMELDPYFNAGYGSVLTSEGNVELEASIMNGTTLQAGCVSLVKDIKHPISLARRVMKTPHNFLAGDGAMRFAKQESIEILDPPGQLVTDFARMALEEWKEGQLRGEVEYARTEIGSENKYSKGEPGTLGTVTCEILDPSGQLVTDFARMALDERKEGQLRGEVEFARSDVDSENKYKKGEVGTVGAVAIDNKGNIAVATSTGGITGKLPGRVGDTPLVGGGTFADNAVGGVSTTGHGETIMKYCLAHDIIKRIVLLGEDAQTATESSCRTMTERLKGTAGAITIDSKGRVGISFTSKRMAWAYLKDNTIHYGIEQNQHLEKSL
ncbi:probable isoaspartyl peptidase/L-asparaginase GA20639 [Topomyia yanbarensis]|uniref:probable isoaspartyl peptidase/L-asparaginase GA20639 n=1 Tax=Topomyia yanbarensis TaxID=2498891 RepID=UPI00273AA5CD|nr:probable isoaspartyl peptidase/L-asparaginase GA20639 [Topomyia yanbarensis]